MSCSQTHLSQDVVYFTNHFTFSQFSFSSAALGFTFVVHFYQIIHVSLFIFFNVVFVIYVILFLIYRDIQQDQFRGNHPHWRGASFVYNHYLFLVCFMVVLLSIMLYLLRLRRIHRRMQRNTSSSALWVEQGLQPSGLPGTL